MATSVRSRTILLVYLLSIGPGRPVRADPPDSRYDAPTRALTVALNGTDRFRYVFNKGGAINGIYDLQLARTQNLVGPSFQGETTDRVIQWTYWNGRYQAPENPAGDHDTRANVTMEGSFANAATCAVLAEPVSGTSRRIQFRSRIEHWFYANLDRHGRPNFETTSTYDVLEDGSLKLTRAVLRHPWKLRDIQEKDASQASRLSVHHDATTMVCEQHHKGSITSYFEAWSPLDHRPLPRQKHGKGFFDHDGYRFWNPRELGGWAMAYGDTQAVALVFGKAEQGNPAFKLATTFNKLDQPAANLNILLPAIETDWPDNMVLTQILIIVPGAPADVERRANALVDSVPVPTLNTVQQEAPAR